MPSYHGYCRSQLDCLILFEAACMGIIPRVSQRLSEDERSEIKSGAIYIWDENEAGVKRWTDGKSWSTSRVSGPFLIYRELDSSGAQNSSRCQVKPYGLCKQSASITIDENTKLHLIAYYKKEDVRSGALIQPSIDMNLKEITTLLKKRNVGLMTPESGTPPPRSPLALAKPVKNYPVVVRQSSTPYTRMPSPPVPMQQTHTQSLPQSPPMFGTPGPAYMAPIQRVPTPPMSVPRFMPQQLLYEGKGVPQEVRVFDEDRRQLSLLDKSLSAY